MAFFLSHRLGFAVAQIPRSGNNSIREWLGHGMKVVSNDNPRLLSTEPRIAFIREPIERLKSAYSLFHWLQMEKDGVPHCSGVPAENWCVFVDHVLNDQLPDDEHYMPQVEHIGSTPTVYHRLEYISKIFHLYKPGVFPHKMATTRAKTPYYRLPELVEKYQPDFELWENIS